MRKISKRLIAVLVIVFIILLIAVPKLTFLKSETGNAQPQRQKGGPGGGLNVEVFVPKEDKIYEKIFSTGTLLANEDARLRSEVSGRIMKIHFREGSVVNKGDLLVKINDAELQAQLEKLDSRKKLTEDKAYRYKTMFEKELASQEEYDVVLNELKAVEADIQLVKAQIEKTEIRAPFSGKIGLRAVSEGSYVSSADQIASIQSINPIKIDFSIPEKYFNQVQNGTAIIFKVQGIDKEFSGEIYAIEPRIDVNTRTLQVRAISQNNDSKLLPGAFASIEIIINEIEKGLMVPSYSIVQDVKGVQVYKVENGKAVVIPVETGIRNADDVQILKGVNPGDSVITTGILQVKPGIPVNVVNKN